MKYLLLTLLTFTPLSASGQVNSCRELYDAYGNYIRTECSTRTYAYNTPQPQPQYYCNPSRTIIGGLLGTAVGGALSRGNGRYWAMPLGGAIGAAGIGCRYGY